MKNINNVSKKEVLEAINYYFTNGFSEELTSDKKYYVNILLKQCANTVKLNLNQLYNSLIMKQGRRLK